MGDPDPSPEREAPGFRTALAFPYMRPIAASLLTARLAGYMYFSLIVLIGLISLHSARIAGLASFFSLMPGLLVSPIAGALLDRKEKTRLIILDYTVAGSSMLLLLVLLAAHSLGGVLFVAIVGCSSLTSSLSASGLRSAFPILLPEDHWNHGNGIDAITGQIGAIGGPVLAGIVFAAFGPVVGLGIVVLLYAASIVLVWRVRIRSTAPPSVNSLARDAWQGAVYLARNPTLRGIAVSISLANLSEGVLLICLPLLLLPVAGSAGVGLIWGTTALGSIGWSLVMPAVLRRFPGKDVYIAGFVLWGAGLLILMSVHRYAVFFLGALVLGAAFTAVNFPIWNLRQQRTHAAVFARVVAVSMSLNSIGSPVGTMIAGLMAVHELRLTMFLGIVVVAIGAVTAWMMIPRSEPPLGADGLGFTAAAEAAAP